MGKKSLDNQVYSDLQICEKLRLNDTSRFFVNKKFKGQIHSMDEWNEIFKKEKLSY